MTTLTGLSDLSGLALPLRVVWVDPPPPPVRWYVCLRCGQDIRELFHDAWISRSGMADCLTFGVHQPPADPRRSER